MSAYTRHILLILAILAVIGIILISGCTQDQTQTRTVNQSMTAGFLKGVSLSPKSFEQNDFIDFFEKVKQTGNIVSWSGDWNELADTQSSGPTVIASLATTYDYIPIIEVQFFTQTTGELLRPLDDATKQLYKSSAADFAAKYKPQYMGLGIEVNVLYEKSFEDFEDFVSFYDEVYDIIKTQSPHTKVFTVFQLEKMKGLKGGLFGGINDPAQAQWSLLELFPKSDIIAFTTYPGLIYEDPSEIPLDYYTEIQLHTTKPIAFTEIGWHSAATPQGWESSEEEQAKFVKTFSILSKDINKEFIIWGFMYDQSTIEPFNSMGIINNDKIQKAAWNEWINIK